jgi:hypothetical protein
MPWVPLEQPTEDDLHNFKAQYRGKARFLVDESAGVEVARLLENRGYNANFVEHIGLRGRSDEDVFAAAWKEKRIVVTHNADFWTTGDFPHIGIPPRRRKPACCWREYQPRPTNHRSEPALVYHCHHMG